MKKVVLRICITPNVFITQGLRDARGRSELEDNITQALRIGSIPGIGSGSGASEYWKRETYFQTHKDAKVAAKAAKAVASKLPGRDTRIAIDIEKC